MQGSRMEVKRFCKQIKPNVPKYLEIPRPFFCESMAESVVLVSPNRGKWKLDVQKSLTDDHYILWSSFVSKTGISNGDIALFKRLHTNNIGIEVYSPSGLLKNGHHRQQQVVVDITSSESSEGSESSEDFMKKEILQCRRRKLQRRKRLRSSSSSQSAGPRKRVSPSVEICASSRLLPLFKRASGQLHWVRNCKAEHLAQGTEAAFARATAFQRERLKNPSMLMVLPGYVNIAYFPKAFTDEYCPWGHEHIELNDEMRESWIVIWQNSKIISGFHKFVAAHNLHRGDVCVFEVKKKGFLVYTFRGENDFLKGKAAVDQQENQKKQHVLERVDENIKLEEHPQLHGPRRALFRNSLSPGRNSKEVHKDHGYDGRKINEAHEDHATTEGVAVMGDMQLQISFRKDAAGVLRPQVSAVMPLEQSQVCPSVLKDLLDAALKKKAE